MRKVMLSFVVTLVLGVFGCDKKQSPGAKSSATEAVSSNASPSSAGTVKTTVPTASKSAKVAGPALKVPAPKVTEKADAAEKGENLSADECTAACENAVKLSVEGQKNAATKEQMHAFGKQDCQKQCLVKGTKKQAACMQGAKSIKDLANCGI